MALPTLPHPPGSTHEPRGLKDLSTHTQILDPTSVSSVPFSLPPATAPVRFSAPSCVSSAPSRKPTVNPTPAPIPAGSGRSSRSSQLHPNTSSFPLGRNNSENNPSEERDKEAIRARFLMGSASSTSLDRYGTNPARTPMGLVTSFSASNLRSPPSSVAQNHSAVFSQSVRLPTHSATLPSPISSSSIRPASATIHQSPVHPPFGTPVFYSSHTQSAQLHHAGALYGRASSLNSSSPTTTGGDRSPIIHMAPKTPVSPISPVKFGSSGPTHAHPLISAVPSGALSVYPTNTSVVNKPPYGPVVLPVLPSIGATVSTPLPGQVQPEEARKSVKSQPPVVNTGNSGAMIPQPGDWMATMAINAQRAALLAAGVTIPKDYPASTTVSRARLPEPIFHSPNQSTRGQNISGLPMPHHPPLSQSELGQIFGPPRGTLGMGGGSSDGPEKRNGLDVASGTGMLPDQRIINPFDRAPRFVAPAKLSLVAKAQSGEGAKQASFSEGMSAQDFHPKPQLVLSKMGLGPDKTQERYGARMYLGDQEEEGEEGEGDEWKEMEMISDPVRRRSFSTGAKMAWGSSGDEVSTNSSSSTQGKEKNGGSVELKKSSFGLELSEIFGKPKGLILMSGKELDEEKEFNGKEKEGIRRKDELFGNGRDFDIRINSTSFVNSGGNKDEGPGSSWQAIKALWQ